MSNTMDNDNNSLIEQQLIDIKAAGLWTKPQELGLEENSKQYTNLYESGISQEKLAQRIIDQWNKAANTDYFKDKEQLQKANSYAEFLIKENKGAATESITDKINKFKGKKTLTDEEHDELWKLLEEQERERSNKQKGTPTDTPKGKDPLMQSLFDKLNDINEHRLTYNNKEITRIKTVALPGIPLPVFNSKSEETDGVKETTMTIGMKKVSYKAWVRHHRLNRVAEKFNNIGDNPKKGLNYIASMCKKREGGKPMAGLLRSVRKWLEDKEILNNQEVFMKKVAEQKKTFIDDITQGITRKEEVDTIKDISDRIDYFAQQHFLKATSKLLNIDMRKSPETPKPAPKK